MADDTASQGSHDSQDTDDLAIGEFDYSDDDSDDSHHPSDDDDAPFTPYQKQLLEFAYDEIIGKRQHLNLDSGSDSESEMEDDDAQVEGPASEVDASFMSRTSFEVEAGASQVEGSAAQPDVSFMSLESVPEPSAAVVSAAKPPAKAKVDKLHSIIHEDFTKNRVVLFSIDVETGGDRAGILQISVEAFTPDGQRFPPFDEYVKPPAGAAISARHSAIHGLTLTDPRIQAAGTIEQVWPRFVKYVEQHLDGGNKKGVMVAWGGQSCDCEWLFRVAEVWHPATLSMPKGLDFFLDPNAVIKNYTSCRLSHKHSGLEGFGLGTVWCYVKEQEELQGAHSSLVDCKAQTDVVLDDRFSHFVNRYKSIMPMTEVWKKKREKAIKQQAELQRPVPPGWKEDDTTTWVPPRSSEYTGSQGGGVCGPSSAVKTAVGQNNGLHPLVNLWYFCWSRNMLQKTANASEQYGIKDWVKATTRYDADGNPRKRPIFRQCSSDDPDRRHRHPANRTWKKFSVGLLLAFFSVLMFRGAYNLRSVELFWESPPDGVSVPFVQNLMTRDTFRQVRRFLHFVDSTTLPKPKEPGWHPLQKINWVLKEHQNRLQLAWVLGVSIVVDESMILYNGRAINWVQYMPRKPIKHGIKVFALCCGVTGVLVSFLVYTGKEYALPGEDWTSIGVVDRLLAMAGLLNKGIGRVLYTDNFYTSISLMKHCWQVYSFFVVGTYVLSKKLSRTAADFPFHKLSNTALQMVNRGWMRRATRVFGTGARSFIGQATVWKDKKEVAFLHNRHVEPIGEHTVLRYSKDTGSRTTIPSHPVTEDYSAHYGAVDQHDQNTSDWSISVKSNRFYLRIFFWLLDASIQLMYNIAIRLDSMPEWKQRYGDKNKGRRRFQIDLAMALSKHAIQLDWDGDLDNPAGKPEWIRQIGYIPCNCGCCFFCKKGWTNGIDHKTVTKPPPRRQVPVQCSAERKEIRTNPQHCAVCYRSLSDNYHGDLKGADRFKHLRMQCSQSRLGCQTCNIVVCSFHWAIGFTHNTADYGHGHH